MSQSSCNTNACFRYRHMVWLLLSMSFCINAHAIPILSINTENADGRQIGKQLAQHISQQYPAFAKDYDEYLAANIAAYQWSKWALRAEQVRAAVPQKLREEIDEVAQRLALSNTDALGDGQLSANELWVAQIFLEQDPSNRGVGFGIMDAATAESGLLVGHNQYGLNHPALLRLRAITVYNRADKTLINIGFAGFSGILTGYNSDGLFAAYLPSPQPSVRIDDAHRTSIALHLRAMLEDNQRIAQSLPDLMLQPFFTSHNLLLADNSKVQILEQALPNDSRLRTVNSPLRMETQWQRPWQIAVVDCFVLRGSPRNCSDSRDLKHWYRLRDLAQFSPQHPADLRDMQNILLDQQDAPYQSLFTEDTVYSTVFQPLERRLFLYTIGSQTADGLPVYEEIEVPLPTRYTLDNMPFYQHVITIVIFIALLGILLLSVWSPPLGLFKPKKSV